MSDENIYRKMTQPDFQWENFSYEDLTQIGMDTVDSKKHAHRILGRLALVLAQKKLGSLKEFAKDVGISYHGLTAYKSVEKTFDGVDLPEDYSWGAILSLASSSEPLDNLQHAVEEGLSSAEVIRTYGKLDQKKKDDHVRTCPKCGAEVAV